MVENGVHPGRPTRVFALLGALVLACSPLVAANGTPGVPTLSGTFTFALTDLQQGHAEGVRQSQALSLSSKLGPTSTFSFTYDRGLRDALSNNRNSEDRTRVIGALRHGGWEIAFGNEVSSPGHALAGPLVASRGASIRRLSGPLVAEFTASQPTAWHRRADGHIWRALAGVRAPRGSIAVSVSDYARPDESSASRAREQVAAFAFDMTARQDAERARAVAVASNRVRAFGVEGQFTPLRAQNFAFRLGEVSLAGANGSRLTSLAGEASYSLAATRVGITARSRQMPPTLIGIALPSSEFATDTRVSVNKNLQLVGTVTQYSTATLGNARPSGSRAASVGIRATRRATLVELRGNVRDARYGVQAVRRTVSALTTLSKGPWSIASNADVGQEVTPRGETRVGFLQGSVRWARGGNVTSLSITHSDNGGRQQERTDVLTSMKIRRMEVAGGSWITRGYVGAGYPGSWFSIGVPTGGESVLTAGLDYTPRSWTARPSLRGVISVRKRFTAPLPLAARR